MSALYLEPQSLVVVCPDCGQRYDPAKAARVARVRTRDGRTIKPGRVEAQDVREPGHRNGRHHFAHAMVTAQALDGWSLLTDALAVGARQFGVEVEWTRIDAPTSLRFIRTWDLDCLIAEMDECAKRETARRIWRASMAVRVDHPWWRAYLHEVGASAEEIARGLTVGVSSRGDVLFRQRVQTVPTPEAASLPGLT